MGIALINWSCLLREDKCLQIWMELGWVRLGRVGRSPIYFPGYQCEIL